MAHLDVTAVKGFAVVDTERITVSDTGVLGNREFFFVEPDGRVYSVDVDSALLPYWSRYAPTTNRLAIGDSQEPILEEAVPVEGEVKEFDFFESSPRAGRFVAGPWDAWASSVAERPLTLVRSVSPGGAYDAYPLTFRAKPHWRRWDRKPMANRSTGDAFACRSRCPTSRRRSPRTTGPGGPQQWEPAACDWEARSPDALELSIIPQIGPAR